MADELVYIPREVQLHEVQEKKRVCRQAFNFLAKFHFVKVDKRNPILHFKPDLRQALLLRRVVHKMFDMLICDEWMNMIGQGQFRDYKFLILRDCHLTFDLISQPKELHGFLQNLYYYLKNHLQACRTCHYNDEMCKICRSNQRLIVRYQIDQVGRCPQCRTIGHKECVRQPHDCRYTPGD